MSKIPIVLMKIDQVRPSKAVKLKVYDRGIRQLQETNRLKCLGSECMQYHSHCTTEFRIAITKLYSIYRLTSGKLQAQVSTLYSDLATGAIAFESLLATFVSVSLSLSLSSQGET